MARNYYEVLGVAKTATDKELKQAFRRLAKQYHPDANPNDPSAEARFKELNEAYEVLSDAEKRAQYDRFGSAYQQYAGGSAPGGGPTYYSNVDMGEGAFSDIFESLFGGRGGKSRTRGGGFGGFAQAIDGRDIDQPVRISLREAYEGSHRLVTKGDRTVRVNIPRGAADGTRIRLAGEGEPGADGGRAGDLYLVVEVEPDAQFDRQGDDLHTEVRVDLFTALLGGEVQVPTLDRPVKLRVPAGTQSGRKFRLTGKGMPVLRKDGVYGDLYARAMITIPQTLTDEQRALVERLRASLG